VLDNQPMHTPCAEGGGAVCDGAGSCVECVSDVDCASLRCEAPHCLAPSCGDHLKNGAETDVDCGGACPPCMLGQGCLVDGDCQGGACDPAAKSCLPSCSDGAVSPPLGETDVDCGGPICAPCGRGGACVVDGDCAGASCGEGHCQLIPTCSDGAKNGAESDVDCGGPICAACPDGAACGAMSDCQSGSCQAAICAAPSCSDGVKNGAELGVDCGAACGKGCPDGAPCGAAADCKSAVCSGPPGAQTCAAPTCSDGVQNGSETDFDCGGSCPQKCPLFYGCLADGDCLGGNCAPASHTCGPSCTDGVQDGAETDVDCGGPCPVKCPLLQHCSSNADCVNDHCVTGHCLP
jgi:hypothetical protein